MQRNSRGDWLHLRDDATVAECGLRQGELLKLKENRGQGYSERISDLEASDQFKLERRERLAELISEAENSSPSRFDLYEYLIWTM